MIKNLRIFSFAFLPFFVVGILSARLVFNKAPVQSSPSVAQTTQTVSSNQRVFLLVQVDDLTLPSSRLMTIHVLFLASAENRFVEAMQIFPSTDPGRDALLASQYALDSNNKLDSNLST